MHTIQTGIIQCKVAAYQVIRDDTSVYAGVEVVGMNDRLVSAPS